jgi:hypothetical protein
VSDEQADVMLTNRFTAAKFGWEPRWYNPALERWLHRISCDAGDVGQNDKLFPVPCRALGQALPNCVEIVPHGHACVETGITAKGSFHRGASVNPPFSPDALPPARHGGPQASRRLKAELLYDPKKGADEYSLYRPARPRRDAPST